MPVAITTTGSAVAIMPIDWPAMMLVAWPVTDAFAIRCTGQYAVSVKNSVIATISTVTMTPTSAAKKRWLGSVTNWLAGRYPLVFMYSVMKYFSRDATTT